MLPSEAFEYIISMSDIDFDPKVVQIFKKKIAPFSVGTCVLLSNGFTGIVVENFENFNTRPRIRIIKDQNNQPIATPYDINLTARDKLSIVITGIVKE